MRGTGVINWRNWVEIEGKNEDVQELVETGDDNSHNHTEEPGSNGTAGHVRIIGVGYGGPNFGVW